jgi:hypothetical protein
MNINVYNNTAHVSSNLEMIQTFINSRIDKYLVVYSDNRILYNNKNEKLQHHKTTWINFANIMVRKEVRHRE